MVRTGWILNIFEIPCLISLSVRERKVSKVTPGIFHLSDEKMDLPAIERKDAAEQAGEDLNLGRRGGVSEASTWR